MPHSGYQSGGTYGVCDRCAEVNRLRDLRKEWSGLMVCHPCYDPRPPYLDAPNFTPEGLPVPNARPEPAEIDLDDADPVLPGDL